MKDVHQFLKELKFEYEEVSGSKKLFPMTKPEENRSEVETQED